MSTTTPIANTYSTTSTAESVLSLQNVFLSQSNLQESAAAWVSELAHRLNFDRVSIGLITNRHADLIASSYVSNLSKDAEFVACICAAMDEAALQNVVISYPDLYDVIPRITNAHTKLTQYGGFNCCSIPIVAHQSLIGVLTVERLSEKPITYDEISTLMHTTNLIAPLIELKKLNDRSIYKQVKERFNHWLNKQHQGHKLINYGFFAGLACLGALLFLPIDYNIKAPARLEGLIQRALVAPQDGFLQQTYVRPGDVVKKDQLLLELSDQDLTLEKNRWESELAQYENAYGASIAGSDRVQMVINQSKMEEARSQLALANYKLERTKMRAPFDGVIIKGDLKQSLGAPVQRGDVLITISPDKQFRLIAEVDERDVSKIKPQQKGSITLVSLPNKSIEIKVKNITPIATTKDGRNFFEVESMLVNKVSDPNLRPGLKGVVKIHVGKRSLIWVWTHRITEWLLLTKWSWGL